ncbi:putative 2-oxoglutarate/Fe(II)-dependent dioxygenase [Hibiscus syriacus]|uniref:2-oxoglutarate/Fe(II)-dependent dioxygenase n=1 Tax=Hibiscus syriacus TaxID=106335 RepID=A0A6A2Y080_HIBSY|nr:putative 2-oxoglutarate/Fe(II)-dependent dioxygenase [Hibiscus syriacus]
MAAKSNVEDQHSLISSFSVQELVKEPMKTIPQQKDSGLELEKLHSTCRHWGFFQLVNHGVNSWILEKVKQEIEVFYKLPLEEKMKFKIREGDTEGYGNIERTGGRHAIFEDDILSPCPQPELVMGVTPHSDATLITILHQLNGVDGLHIHKDGVWFPFSFLPDALVVNVGDILEIFSNGVYRSIEHKVVPNAEKERMSVAFFVNPKLEADVGPSPSLMNPHNPPLFKRVSLDRYIKGFFSQMLNGKSYLQHMRIDCDGDDNSA